MQSSSTLSVTDIVAIIGCITGCASLFISFYKLLAEKGSFRVKTNRYHNKYFRRLPESNFFTKYQAMIYVELINATPNPITIYDIDLRIKGNHHSPHKCPTNTIILTQQQPNNITTRTQTDMSNSLTAPYTIEPFHVYTGYMFIPHIHHEIASSEYFLMTLRTTYKTKYLVGKIKQHQYKI